MRILWTGAAALALAVPASAQTLRGDVERQMPSLMAIYKDLHANPELSFMEVRSAGILAAEARKLGFRVTEKVGGTGVVAVMENGPGPVVMVRADMDGLPVTEQTGLPGASKIRVTTKEGVETGVMHACGHDTHMTAWIGVARLMAANKSKWSGTLVMIGQPAEERGAGARMMLADGLYSRFPKPQYALAFHDAAQFPAGKIGYTPGYALANVDSVDVLVKGVGGHGAYPQTTKDPIVLASRIVGALQTLVSREISPLDSAVVTVGSFHAGAKHNIISDEARLQLTVRSYTDEVREHLLDGIARIAKGEAIAADIPADRMPVVTVQKDEYTPATFNTVDFTEEMAAFLTTSFGSERVVKMPPVMGGEDFSRFSRDENKDVKSLIVWVGGVPQAEYDAAKKEGRTLPSLHSPFWAPDAPAVISTATEALTAMTMKLMAKK
ncbi:MAG: amidohydrolase [Sphingopyxis sp.]|uniref:amidohydrolase n=1 Tax=Sphingopyxis sp. TaxID=1908224 RepID=UPI001A1BD183|nr:amidohydrolase [Sphingopyxis sp.]MBJ7500875.1 amidohydrolase [Sphingopyxis sp.]